MNFFLQRGGGGLASDFFLQRIQIYFFLLRIQIENKKVGCWWGGGGRERRAGVSDFFYYESKFKIFFMGESRLSKFFTNNPNRK